MLNREHQGGRSMAEVARDASLSAKIYRLRPKWRAGEIRNLPNSPSEGRRRRNGGPSYIFHRRIQ